MSKFTVLILALMAFASSSSAFAPSSTVHRASFVTGAVRPTSSKKTIKTLNMSEEKDQPQVSADGTFYDDEMDSTPVSKQGISDSMAERLRREASTGESFSQSYVPLQTRNAEATYMKD